jgi:2-oxoglutarate ferredoxin oxidoreductase subunit beta
MILRQKGSMKPDTYGNVVDRPFRPNAVQTGVLARNDRPEYGDAYRAAVLGAAGAAVAG